MSQKSDPTTTTGWQDRRRGVRLNSRVQLAVEWENASGVTLRAQGFTRVVNSGGCLLLLPQDLALDQRVRILNLNLPGSEPAPALVVWKGRETPEGFEIGVEFVKSQLDFWGLQL
jgi:hypothetical protein